MLMFMLAAAVGCGTFIEGPLPEAWGEVVVASPAGDGEELVLDARAAEDYAAGHIPGAANVHWTELTGPDDQELWGALPPEELAVLFASRGVTADRPVLVYGSGPEGYGDDGNVYWALRYLGHPEVRVLNGGWAGWLSSGGALSTAADDHPEPAAQFDDMVEANPEVLASTAEVAAWPGVLLDVRSEEEWLGGHIPGAVWMEWTEVFGTGGALEDAGAQRERFAALGIGADTAVAVYCAGGIRAGHTFMVLDALEHPEVKNYVGSWARWTAEGGEVAYPEE